MRRDEAAAVEMPGRADMVEMLVAQHHHVDIVRLHADMVEACHEMRVVRGQSDIDQNGARAAAHQVSVGCAVLEADLIDVLGRLDQRSDLGVEQYLERTGPALAHDGPAALKATVLEARRRLLSASMIISAKAGCWLTR